MKIVVVSDTHVPRFARRFELALARIADERPELILHCGDVTTLAATDALAAIAPFDAVGGNNDDADVVRRYGRRKIVDAGVRIGMIHGDGSRGTTLGRALAAFEGERIDAIAFGHSHVPYLARHGDVWVVNPGSISDKRREPRYSYAVLERDDGGALAPRLAFF